MYFKNYMNIVILVIDQPHLLKSEEIKHALSSSNILTNFSEY
jgi:hypothetical protein